MTRTTEAIQHITAGELADDPDKAIEEFDMAAALIDELSSSLAQQKTEPEVTDAGEAEPESDSRVYIALAKPDAMTEAFGLAQRLREQGIRTEIEQAGRSMKGQLKQADRIGARATVIVGDGIEVKDMDSGEQRAVRDADEAAARVGELLG